MQRDLSAFIHHHLKVLGSTGVGTTGDQVFAALREMYPIWESCEAAWSMTDSPNKIVIEFSPMYFGTESRFTVIKSATDPLDFVTLLT